MDGWTIIELVPHPAQFLDLNINDSGVFSSLKSLVRRKRCRPLDTRIDGVKIMYDQYDANTLKLV